MQILHANRFFSAQNRHIGPNRWI